MLNKVSTVSILLIIAIALILFFGVKNGKKCSEPATKSGKSTTTTTEGADASASAFRGKRN